MIVRDREQYHQLHPAMPTGMVVILGGWWLAWLRGVE
jgi:hypothetical protein